MGFKQAKILSVSSVVPDNVLTNHDLEKMVDTSDEWITKRTGIKQRHIAPKEMKDPLIEYGSKAVVQALEKAGVKPDEVDTIVCGTISPDYFFPSTACSIATKVGCNRPFAFDYTSACSGFIYGLILANSFIVSGQSKTVVVVGGEILSRCVDWEDRGTCIIFADGVGAAVLQGSDDPNKGILATDANTDGSFKDILYLTAWEEKNTIVMKGKEVFKHAISLMANTTRTSLEKCGLTVDDVDLFIPHQANVRIINAVASNLKIPMEKLVSNVDRFGNTSSASIPIAMDEAWQEGRIKEGSVVALTALGGGITIGSAIVRF